MTRIAFVGLALALISACVVNPGGDGGTGSGSGGGGGGGSGSGSGGGSGSGSGSGSGGGGGSSVSPHAGLWTYGELTPVSSTCSATTPHGEGGNFAIDQVLPASFRIVPNDSTAPFICASSSAGFSCPNRASLVVDDRPSVDAVITVHVTATGRFSDGAHGTGRQAARVDCTGTQCGLIGPFPCDFAVDFAIRAF
ncbi:MAG: hypothetical protein E6J90_51435 [Deltaproteobacteria bacterium]|nr:MAG: hypothetical protein E6J90_51435 [Deltaproteobacteria bacterium]